TCTDCCPSSVASARSPLPPLLSAFADRYSCSAPFVCHHSSSSIYLPHPLLPCGLRDFPLLYRPIQHVAIAFAQISDGVGEFQLSLVPLHVVLLHSRSSRSYAMAKARPTQHAG